MSRLIGAGLIALCAVAVALGFGPRPQGTEQASAANCMAAVQNSTATIKGKRGKGKLKRRVAGRPSAAGLGDCPLPDSPAPTPPDRLQVEARDTTQWALLLSRPDVNEGDVGVQLVNAGQDDHNLHLQQGGAPPEYVIPDTLPGEHKTATFPLTAGTWKLWCSLPGHESAGMVANLTVNP